MNRYFPYTGNADFFYHFILESDVVLTIKKLLQNNSFYHDFQPIYGLTDWKTIGYEVLFRSSNYPNPMNAFQRAKKEKQLYELDSRSIQKAALSYETAGFSKKDGFLFVNVFPSTILDPKFPSFIEEIISNINCSRQQIILELNETEIIPDFDAFKKLTAHLKSKGFLIAIDDAGKDNSSFMSILELEPDFVKLDRYFSKELHTSVKKQHFIQMLLDYCKKLGIHVILEGIEDEKDLAFAKFLGVPFGQGYIFGKPQQLMKAGVR
jgi:EAL domain-containing protein (putative c-di-GMP-specific phosphodiesterase class I)